MESSRETAPDSELASGIRIVIARSIEKIYGQNSQNIGFSFPPISRSSSASKKGEAIPIAEFTRGLDPISAAIVDTAGSSRTTANAWRDESRCRPSRLWRGP